MDKTGERQRKRVRTLLVTGVAALGAVAATALPATAAVVDVPLGTYTAALPISPFPTVTSSTNPSHVGFPVTFTNTSSPDYVLEHVQVTVPAGFTVASGSSVSNGHWTVRQSGQTVSADANDITSDGLDTGESVVLTLQANAPTVVVPTTFTFSTAAAGLLGTSGIVGDFSNEGGDPQVTVFAYSNVVTCAPSQICDTGLVGNASDTQARVVTTTGQIQDWVGLSVDTPTDVACLSQLSPNGRSEQLSFTDIDPSRTLTTTLRIDKSVVNAQPINGAGRYGVCLDTGNPSKVFVDKNGNTTSAGFLPDCSASGLLPRQPCLKSVTKNGAGDILMTFTTPGGDPLPIGGLPI